ncbi:MAG: hypothetical protein PHH49_05685 [Candidatus Omnitrophica bacterium]|nr:hypothetical protein [Candidatus Omnitrophota bacterium]MDD5488434.1 hypothetical protein [Candidatus Omnitrophota bacterium]
MRHIYLLFCFVLISCLFCAVISADDWYEAEESTGLDYPVRAGLKHQDPEKNNTTSALSPAYPKEELSSMKIDNTYLLEAISGIKTLSTSPEGTMIYSEADTTGIGDQTQPDTSSDVFTTTPTALKLPPDPSSEQH